MNKLGAEANSAPDTQEQVRQAATQQVATQQAPKDQATKDLEREDAIEGLIRVLSRMPGLGRRSAARVALRLLSDRPLLDRVREALRRAEEEVLSCETCGNLCTHSPCRICSDPKRDGSVLCVVEGVDDILALERSQVYRGLYHVLGGTLSALEGRSPATLEFDSLKRRVVSSNGANGESNADAGAVREVILALSATVEGQTTAHYIADMLRGCDCRLSVLGQGLPVGGSLNYLDDGTLFAAFRSRSDISPAPPAS